MPICSHCGVEIEEGHEKCPLCGTPLSGEVEAQWEEDEDSEPRARQSETAQGPGRDHTPESPEGSYSAERREALIEEHDEKVRLLFREVFGFIALAAAVVVAAVDFAFGMDIDWSRYPLASLGYAWLIVFIVRPLRSLHIKNRAFLILAVQTGITLVFLYLLDTFTSGRPWFTGLALPLTMLLAVLAVLSILVIRHFGLKALGGISTALVAAGVFTLGTELILRVFQNKEVLVSWSIIPATAVIPIIAFLVFFEKRLKKRGSNLSKYFHV